MSVDSVGRNQSGMWQQSRIGWMRLDDHLIER